MKMKRTYIYAEDLNKTKLLLGGGSLTEEREDKFFENCYNNFASGWSTYNMIGDVKLYVKVVDKKSQSITIHPVKNKTVFIEEPVEEIVVED